MFDLLVQFHDMENAWKARMKQDNGFQTSILVIIEHLSISVSSISLFYILFYTTLWKADFIPDKTKSKIC